MFSSMRSALKRLSVRSVQRVAAGPEPTRKADFHHKYGLFILLGGTCFFLVTWREALAYLNLSRYMTLHRSVRPKPWRKA